MDRGLRTLVRVGLAAVVVVVTAAGLPSRLSAELIPGSGPGLAASDCYVELNVQGIDNPGPDVRGGRVVSCTDGDPCDVDGECGNNSCTLRVAVCIDQRDPNLPTCHPPSHLQKLHVNSKLAAAVPTPLDSACGSFIDLPIPLHRVHNGTQAGRLRLPANATAPTGTNPLRDRDAFVVECLPRTTPCASTTTTTTAPTTTTTSSTSTSTTTTSIQGTTTTTSTTTTTVPCPAGETDCSGTCVDTNTDPNHC